MFNRRDGGFMGRMGLFVIVILVVVLVAFGDSFKLAAPSLDGPRIAGLIVMVAGLACVLLSGKLAALLPGDRRETAAPLVKLAGVAVCAAGALIVFMH